MSGLVAAVTAAVVGLLIAGTAGAARSAAQDHARQAQQDVLAGEVADADLAAYQDRLQQAYAQLAASYQALSDRDAAYQQALQQESAVASELSAADSSKAARLSEAYQQLSAAQADVQRLQGQLQSATAELARRQAATPVAVQPTAVATPPPASPSTAPLRRQQRVRDLFDD